MKAYVTKTNEIYHIIKKCVERYNYREISVQEAITQKLRLCKTCAARMNGQKIPNYKNNRFPFYNKNKKEFNIKSNEADEIIPNHPLMNLDISEQISILQNPNNINNNLDNNSIDFNEKYEEKKSENLDIKNEIESDEQEEEKIDIKSEEDYSDDIIKNFNLNDISEIKENNVNNIHEKIEAKIEKDKRYGANMYKKYELRSNNKINKKKYNYYIEDNKDDNDEIDEDDEDDNDDESFSYKQDLASCKNFSYGKINLCGVGDMDILKQTYESAVSINLLKNMNSNNNNTKHQKDLQRGIYKFTFEIKNLKKDERVEIEVGFEIIYRNTLDINFQDKNLINSQKKKIKVGTSSDKLNMTKHLIIYEDTGKIFAFINIKKGKLFIIGKDELDKRKNNIYLKRDDVDIFYIKNCGVSYYHDIVSVEPILNFNEQDLMEKCKIKFNGKFL